MNKDTEISCKAFIDEDRDIMTSEKGWFHSVCMYVFPNYQCPPWLAFCFEVAYACSLQITVNSGLKIDVLKTVQGISENPVCTAGVIFGSLESSCHKTCIRYQQFQSESCKAIIGGPKGHMHNKNCQWIK